MNQMTTAMTHAAPFRRFDGSTVKNLTFEIGNINAPNYLNAGGVFGNGSNSHFENITVNHHGTVFSDDQRGGFAGFSDGPNTFKNITVNNFTVDGCAERDGWNGSTSGFSPYIGGDVTIEAITINNTTIRGCNNGNFAGFADSNFGNLILKNIRINGLTMDTIDWGNIGGFMGTIDAPINISDVIMNDVSINSINSNIGGFVLSSAHEANIFNIEMNNTNIHGDSVEVGGFLNGAFPSWVDDGNGGGYEQRHSLTLDNIRMTGLNINNNDNNPNHWTDVSGFARWVDAYATINNISLSNFSLDSLGGSLYGFMGSSENSLSVDGVIPIRFKKVGFDLYF